MFHLVIHWCAKLAICLQVLLDLGINFIDLPCEVFLDMILNTHNVRYPLIKIMLQFYINCINLGEDLLKHRWNTSLYLGVTRSRPVNQVLYSREALIDDIFAFPSMNILPNGGRAKHLYVLPQRQRDIVPTRSVHHARERVLTDVLAHVFILIALVMIVCSGGIAMPWQWWISLKNYCCVFFDCLNIVRLAHFEGILRHMERSRWDRPPLLPRLLAWFVKLRNRLGWGVRVLANFSTAPSRLLGLLL